MWGDEAAGASQLPVRLKPVLVPAHNEGELPDVSERVTPYDLVEAMRPPTKRVPSTSPTLSSRASSLSAYS